MKKENEKLKQKLEAKLLEESLGTTIDPADKVEDNETVAKETNGDTQDEIGINEEDTGRGNGGCLV